MRIGVLGGTFDPIHRGHISLAEAAVEALELDELIFVPANRNPAKNRPRIVSARHRLKMVEIAVRDYPKFSVSDIEIVRGGASYALETLQDLNQVRPAEYWFILGTDAAKSFENWKQPEKILRLCRLGVGIRPPQTWDDFVSRLSPEVIARMDPILMKPLELSATDIRERIRKKHSLGNWVPAGVLQYIRENHLYEN